MKATIDRATLESAVKLATRITVKNADLYSQFKLVVDDGTLHIYSASQELFGHFRVPAEQTEPGVEVVNAAMLQGALLAAGDTVALSPVKQGVRCKVGTSVFTLARHNKPELFPLMHPHDDRGAEVARLEGSYLASLFTSLAPFTDPSTAVPERSSLAAWIGDGMIIGQTTDTIRFGKVVILAETNDTGTIILPIKPVVEAAGLIKDAGMATLLLGERWLTIDSESTEIRISTVWSASEPNYYFHYQDGRSDHVKLNMDVKLWRRAIRALTNTGAPKAALYFNRNSPDLVMRARGNMGEAEYVIGGGLSFAEDAPESFEVWLQIHLLDDTLRACPGEIVQVGVREVNPRLPGPQRAWNAPYFKTEVHGLAWEHFLMPVSPEAK